MKNDKFTVEYSICHDDTKDKLIIHQRNKYIPPEKLKYSVAIDSQTSNIYFKEKFTLTDGNVAKLGAGIGLSFNQIENTLMQNDRKLH